MRLIGIGLLAFLFAGLALLLARSEMVGQTWRALSTLTDGPQLRFETPLAAESRSGAERAIIRRAGPAAPLILSGLPAYQGAVFHMPIDARPTSGYLQIDATSQVLEGVEGVLRISIGNTRRAEVLLHPGEAVRSARIELTPADIAQARLVVSFSLLGTGANPVCAQENAVDAVVEIETTSALYLALDAPLETPRDRIAAWGDQLRLTWTIQSRTLLRGVDAYRAGKEVLFVPQKGLSVAEAEVALVSILANRTPQVLPEYGWSDAMSDDAELFRLRRFQRSHTWRFRYNLAAALNANLPQMLELSMLVPRHPMGADWQITVTQDDHLLAHMTGSADQTNVREQIVMPPLPGPEHVIDITLTSSFQPDGECNDGPEILAEILPDTRITPSPDSMTDHIRTLRAALAKFPSIDVTIAGAMNAAEANVAMKLLGGLLPPNVNTSAQGNAPTISVLPRGSQLSSAPGEELWLVYWDQDNRLTATSAAQATGRDLSSVALLVHLPTGAS